MYPSTRYVLMGFLAAFLAALTIGQSSGGSISFLGDQPVAVTLFQNEKTVLSVKVLNNSDTPLDIYLDVAGLINEDGQQILPGALPDLPLTERDVQGGTVNQFELTFTWIKGLSGSYAGQLVAFGSDGSLDRLGFTLSIEQGYDVSTLAGPEYLEKVTLLAVNYIPSPLAGYVHHDAVVETDGTFLGGPATGIISSSNGLIGVLTLDGSTVQLDGITRAGEYVGKMDLLPYDKEKGEVAVSVLVRDFFLWPFIVLVLGLVISNYLDWYIKIDRPRTRLEINLEKLKEKAVDLQEKAKMAVPENWPFGEVYRIYQKNGAEDGLLATAAEKALEAFNAAHSDEGRKKWGPDGEEIKKIQKYVDALPRMYELSRAASKHYLALKNQISDKEPPVLNQVKKAIDVGLIEDAIRLEKIQEDLNSASAFVEGFSSLFWRLNRLKEVAKGTQYEQDVENLCSELISLDTSQKLGRIDAAIDKLEQEIEAIDHEERPQC